MGEERSCAICRFDQGRLCAIRLGAGVMSDFRHSIQCPLFQPTENKEDNNLVSMVLSDLKDGPDPEAERYLDKNAEWPWYTLKKGVNLTDDLEDQLEDIGYVNLGPEDGFIYDEICDRRTDLHKSIYGDKYQPELRREGGGKG